MDELDRMYRRLVQNIRAGFPDLMGRPFEIAEVYTTLIPYRHNRRELELDTNQDYEHALLRLLSGERGYLIGDPQMQADLRAEIESSNPDLTKFRAYSTTMVSLAPDGARNAEPPPLRRPGIPALVGWIGMAYAVVVALAGTFGVTFPTWAGWLAIAGFIGGFGILMSRLPRHRPPDAGDGAVL